MGVARDFLDASDRYDSEINKFRKKKKPKSILYLTRFEGSHNRPVLHGGESGVEWICCGLVESSSRRYAFPVRCIFSDDLHSVEI